MGKAAGLLLTLAMAAGAHAQRASLAEAVAQAKALREAPTDASRELASDRLKNALRAVLDAPDGLTVNLDSLPLSRVEAPDRSLRLITWNIPLTDGSHRYEGLLLARSGRLTSLFELRDMSASIPNPELAELGPDRWYGALYYQLIEVRKGGKTWYTLLGWKGHSATETRKVIEVLSFRGGKPRFGAPLFGQARRKEMRKVYAYAFQASMMLRYEPALKRIVLDHLAPLQPGIDGKGPLMGPSMSFDAFVWGKGQWRFERDIDLRDPKDDKRPYTPPPKEPRR